MKYSSMRSSTTNILEFTPAASTATTATTVAATTPPTPSQTPKGPSELMEKEKGINQIGNKTNNSDLNYYNSDKRINQ